MSWYLFGNLNWINTQTNSKIILYFYVLFTVDSCDLNAYVYHILVTRKLTSICCYFNISSINPNQFPQYNDKVSTVFALQLRWMFNHPYFMYWYNKMLFYTQLWLAHCNRKDADLKIWTLNKQSSRRRFLFNTYTRK